MNLRMRGGVAGFHRQWILYCVRRTRVEKMSLEEYVTRSETIRKRQ
jgi:hypothetical protein